MPGYCYTSLCQAADVPLPQRMNRFLCGLQADAVADLLKKAAFSISNATSYLYKNRLPVVSGLLVSALVLNKLQFNDWSILQELDQVGCCPIAELAGCLHGTNHIGLLLVPS